MFRFGGYVIGKTVEWRSDVWLASLPNAALYVRVNTDPCRRLN